MNKTWTSVAAASGLALATLISLTGSSQAETSFEMCQPESRSYASPLSFKSTTIRFEVSPNFGRSVMIYWINLDGSFRLGRVVWPGQALTQKTFQGHKWVAKNLDGCAYFEAQLFPSKIVIE